MYVTIRKIWLLRSSCSPGVREFYRNVQYNVSREFNNLDQLSRTFKLPELLYLFAYVRIERLSVILQIHPRSSGL